MQRSCPMSISLLAINCICERSFEKVGQRVNDQHMVTLITSNSLVAMIYMHALSLFFLSIAINDVEKTSFSHTEVCQRVSDQLMIHGHLNSVSFISCHHLAYLMPFLFMSIYPFLLRQSTYRMQEKFFGTDVCRKV